MKITLMLLLFLALGKTYLQAQQKLYFVKQNKRGKLKAVDLKLYYEIKTKDSIFQSVIIGYTDSTIQIPKYVVNGFDTSRNTIINKKDVFGIDSLGRRRIIKYKIDTINILFSDINWVKRHFNKNRSLQATSGFTFAAGTYLNFLYILGATFAGKFNKSIKNWAIVQGGIIAVTAPFYLIGSIKVKYNLNKKWKLVVK